MLGPGKLPEVGNALGKTIREFRKASTDVQESVSLTPTSPTAAAARPAPAADANETDQDKIRLLEARLAELEGTGQAAQPASKD